MLSQDPHEADHNETKGIDGSFEVTKMGAQVPAQPLAVALDKQFHPLCLSSLFATERRPQSSKAKHTEEEGMILHIQTLSDKLMPFFISPPCLALEPCVHC